MKLSNLLQDAVWVRRAVFGGNIFLLLSIILSTFIATIAMVIAVFVLEEKYNVLIYCIIVSMTINLIHICLAIYLYTNIQERYTRLYDFLESIVDREMFEGYRK